MTEHKDKKVTNKRTVSFSKDFAYLADQLSELPNPNRFICEAIAEKFERQNQAESPLPPAEDMAQLLKWAQQLTAIMSGLSVPMGTMPFPNMGMNPFAMNQMTPTGLNPMGMNPNVNMNTGGYPTGVPMSSTPTGSPNGTPMETPVVAPTTEPTQPTTVPTPPTMPVEEKEPTVSTPTNETIALTVDGKINAKPPSSLKSKRNSFMNMDI